MSDGKLFESDKEAKAIVGRWGLDYNHESAEVGPAKEVMAGHWGRQWCAKLTVD